MTTTQRVTRHARKTKACKGVASTCYMQSGSLLAYYASLDYVRIFLLEWLDFFSISQQRNERGVRTGAVCSFKFLIPGRLCVKGQHMASALLALCMAGLPTGGLIHLQLTL